MELLTQRLQQNLFISFMLLIGQHVFSKEMSQRPNIILIVADDLGWDDVSFHGSDQISTPNIDALAYSGVILNNYYVQPICTPTRAALMTGRHPIHLGLQSGVLGNAKPDGLPLKETLLPQHLNTLGYRSHMVGKWHLGMYANEFTPTYRGFDSHFGYWKGAEDYFEHTSYSWLDGYWGLDFRENMKPALDKCGQYSTEIFTQKAEQVINKHNTSEPLFLYLAHQAVHSSNNPHKDPLQVPQHYMDRFPHIKNERRRKFAGMLAALDDSVGNITKTLHNKGMLDNSIIVFTTDNGGPANVFDMNCACNWPLRGIKHTLWEGGVRGVGLIWSPLLRGIKQTLWEGGVRGVGFIWSPLLRSDTESNAKNFSKNAGGRVSDHMMHVCDWLPTLFHAAGGDASKLKNLDGYNVWSSLTKGDPSPRTEILHNIEPTNKTLNEAAIRVGDFKLVSGISAYAGTHHFNGWYPPTEKCKKPKIDNYDDYIENHIMKKMNNLDSAKGQCNLNDNGDHKNIPKQNLNNSNPLQTILGISDDRIVFKPVVVRCGPKPANVTTNCRPAEAPCLFHIGNDPCEFHNLANEKPEIVRHLLNRLHAWNLTAVPALNSKDDPRGNPANFNHIWTPWINLTTDSVV